METKKSIRQIIRKQRKELDPMIWQSQTAEICRKTCELDIFREATDIYCYIDFGGKWGLGHLCWKPGNSEKLSGFRKFTEKQWIFMKLLLLMN